MPSPRSLPVSCAPSCRSTCPASVTSTATCSRTSAARRSSILAWRAASRVARSKSRLAAAGIPMRRVHTVIVTHSHPDHFGAAGWVRHETGADIVTHRRFRLMWDPSEPPDVDVEDVVDGFVVNGDGDGSCRSPTSMRAGRAGVAIQAAHAVGSGAVGRVGDDDAVPPPSPAATVGSVPAPAACPGAVRASRRRRADPPRRPRVGGAAHPWSHRGPPVPVRPDRRRDAVGRPRAAHDHAPHRWLRSVPRPARLLLRLARQGCRPRSRHQHLPAGPRSPVHQPRRSGSMRSSATTASASTRCGRRSRASAGRRR